MGQQQREIVVINKQTHTHRHKKETPGAARCGDNYRAVSRSRAAKRSLCGGPQQPTIESPLCGLRLCISSPLPDKQTNKERLHLRSSAVRMGSTTRREAPTARGRL